MKNQPANGRRYLQTIGLIKGLNPKYMKNSYDTIQYQRKNPIEKWAEDPNRHFLKKAFRWSIGIRKDLKTANHQGKTNENYHKMSPHTCQIGYDQKDNK